MTIIAMDLQGLSTRAGLGLLLVIIKAVVVAVTTAVERVVHMVEAADLRTWLY